MREGIIMISVRRMGLIVGLVLGITWMWLGFGQALVAGAVGLAGWVVGAIIGNIAAGGHFNLAELWNDMLGRGSATS